MGFVTGNMYLALLDQKWHNTKGITDWPQPMACPHQFFTHHRDSRGNTHWTPYADLPTPVPSKSQRWYVHWKT